MAIPGPNIGHALANTLSPTMRQRRVARAKTFVDFAGDTLPIYSPDDEVALYCDLRDDCCIVRTESSEAIPAGTGYCDAGFPMPKFVSDRWPS